MKLNIIHVHNYYQQQGGEDTVFTAEVELLQDHGHRVVTYTDHNDRINSMKSLTVAIQTIYSRPSYNKLSEVLRNEKPDIVHFHNTFPLISPAGYYACRINNIPVIQSLDNPRLICPAATLFRNGNLCLDCKGKTPPFPGIVHGCYHNSPSQTAVVAAMLSIHRWKKTWQKQVHKYLVATDFYKQLFITAGLPKEKIIVKPHFVQDNPIPQVSNKQGEYVLFIGRLDPEKGIRTLLTAWKNKFIPLKIRGDGKLEQECKIFVEANNHRYIEILHKIPKNELMELIKNSRFLVWPSEGYYETFGMVAVECFAHGVPVIASNIGVIPEIVRNGETGILFEPGNPSDLSAKVDWLWNHPGESVRMGLNARKEYEEKYTPDGNYKMLMEIYSSVISDKKN